MQVRSATVNRRGFTLVEVLVAAGLAMLIMAVITQAFSQGMDTLSRLKTVGELQQRLRSFETVMRSDLEAEHFDGRSGQRVSEMRLDQVANVPVGTEPSWRPPQRGFFAIRQEGLSQLEGIEASLQEGNISTRAVNHILQMTVRRNASRGDRVFVAELPGSVITPLTPASMNQMSCMPNTLVSTWAEVTYFLDTTNPIGRTPVGNVPLYGLYRRVRVIPEFGEIYGDPSVPTWGTIVNSMTTWTDATMCQGVCHAPRVVDGRNRPINDPASVRDPRNRLGGINMARLLSGDLQHYDVIAAERDASPSHNLTGTDLLLTDVLSFEIKAHWDGGTVPPGSPLEGLHTTYEFPFSDLPRAVNPANGTPRNAAIGPARVFDTWYEAPDESWLRAPTTGPLAGQTVNVIPQPMRLRAIQIKVRVWDRHNRMARQVTFVHNL